jgi:UDPglucose 6-dehydrogenase
MKITIFGTGYVGLVTGACLADTGHQVICVDIDAAKVEQLNCGVIPIHEPGLSTLVQRNHSEGRLRFTSNASEGVMFGELQFIAVGTPSRADGSANLEHVYAVATAIGMHMQSPKIVVNKSTVPVGTADQVRLLIKQSLETRGVDFDFDVCSNPEFLKEGSAIEDFSKGARIIVGTNSDVVRQKMRACYAPYNWNHNKLMFMDIRAAELSKYAANAMLATKISFMNEIANLAEHLGVDIEQVRQGIGSDPRIGYHFIYPGCGYGGSCFPKDVRALVHSAEQVGYKTELLNAIDAINHRQKETLFRKLELALNGKLAGKTIAVWGLAFKPNTNDIRDAPSRTLLEALWKAGATVQAFDPEAMDETARIYGERSDLRFAINRDEALKGADALAICTEWKVFRTVDFHWLKQQLKYPVVVDGRNLFNPSDLEREGLLYYAVGRGKSLTSPQGN